MSKHEKYASSLLKLVTHLSLMHSNKEKVELQYLNSTYWCTLDEIKAEFRPKKFGLDLTLIIVTHQHQLAEDFEDGKVKLTMGKYTMLADVGKIRRKKQKNKSFVYHVELNWS